MKTCSTSLIKEPPVQTTMRYNLTLIKMTTIKKIMCWQKCWEIGRLFTVCGIVKWCNCYVKQGGGLKKIKNRTTIWSINPLSIYPSGYISKRTERRFLKRCLYTMFIAALVTIAKKWKQAKCPTVDEWINKMWCIQTMEYYSSLKGTEILSHATTWMNLEDILLSEISQSQKEKHCMISLICGI